MKKKLYRSRENKVFAGILGGLGEYFDVDPVLFRALYVIFTFFSGIFPGLFSYLVLMFVIPAQKDIAHRINSLETDKA